MADRVQSTALRSVNAYGQFVHDDLMPVFNNIDKRAAQVGDEEYERLGSQPAGDDWVVIWLLVIAIS